MRRRMFRDDIQRGEGFRRYGDQPAPVLKKMLPRVGPLREAEAFIFVKRLFSSCSDRSL
jgi:hypothetical protein